MTATDEAMIQVLGAISYGEWRAHTGAKARAEACDDPDERTAWRTVAAQELRHYKGFTKRLEAMGVDPEAAMAAARPVLDAYDAQSTPSNEVEAAVWDFLGEGIADDLMVWFRDVVDDELAAFVETVLADEAEHEDRAAQELRTLLDANEADRALAQQAAERMVANMLGTGGTTNASILAFMQLGRADELLRIIMGGFGRRLTEIGVDTEPVTRIAMAGLAPPASP
jgi:DNA-binding ferritin-like protein (Dps family)